jgi:hypothetical protein
MGILRAAGLLAAVSAGCVAVLILVRTPGYNPIRDAGTAGEASGVFLFLFACAALAAAVVALAVRATQSWSSWVPRPNTRHVLDVPVGLLRRLRVGNGIGTILIKVSWH